MPLPFKLPLFASLLAFTAAGIWFLQTPPPIHAGPEIVEIPAGPYIYRPAGDFRAGNRIVDAPAEQRMAESSFEIMKYHVTQIDYGLCVREGGCQSTEDSSSEGFAQVNVSYLDAKDYAEWLSAKTGETWRLPTDAEWVRAAGDRFEETLLGPISNNPDPSKRWIAKYREEAERRGSADPELREIGSFGPNNYGVVDLYGNIWDWTETCFKNGKVTKDGSTLISDTDYCGVRAAQGKHRAFIIDFVRDAKAGGCAVGIPPDNLGIRLVRDHSSG